MSTSFERFRDKVHELTKNFNLRRLHRTFIFNERVGAETYVKVDKRVQMVEPGKVVLAAGVLESAYAMTEEIPEDQEVALSMSKSELHAFVCYMRQLDSAYREQGEFIARHIKPAESSGEFKVSEEVAQISAERYEQLTGAPARDASLRRAGQLSEKYARDVSLAQAAKHAGIDLKDFLK